MRAVIQRVRRASVAVEERMIASIGPGLLVLLGVARADTECDADWLADKVRALRVFSDCSGTMNEPLRSHEVLCVSQFTLYADTRPRQPPQLRRRRAGGARGAVVRALLRQARRAPGGVRRDDGDRARRRRTGDPDRGEPDRSAPCPIISAMSLWIRSPHYAGYRYLFEQLVRRELRRKYKGSTLGVFWYLINPLVLMGAYTFMFGHVLKVQKFDDFPIYLMIGLVVWMFFQQSLLAASDSLIDQGGLVRKARFPREAIPASTVAVQLFTLTAILVLLAPITVAIRGTLTPALLLAPVLVALLFGFVLGCALIIAVLHAYFRDVAPILAAALLPWFFLTPIFFRPDTLKFVQQHAWVGTLLDWVNPVAPFIEAMRSVLYYGHGPGWGRLVYAAAAATVALALGALVFRRMEGELAVVV
ncbi:MAG: D-aminoacyl-tRNA deacylase [Solirubrobacteraceae bacterium]